ncbi:AAA family ATPase [Flavobacterium crassostreae]|uniref:RecF/RecN/SMC N-terminal domain-containing protein n=1 Tax=Flavobacterium crassostreae TaxID=1763534 RepID=A0A1B9EA76_9FLAO|nr:AAA family ATPase [Flavobacterium crassostreae]OCB78852.1 hypothetical protein LPBF_00255 [Flavobacterium crassostreae]
MKITELILHNFKFFTGTENILKIDSKNVLIWGENGSGKSSIYWAIYTLLQCSYKNKDGIDAYFTDGHEKNLINIHADAGDPSFVQMNLDNGANYKIALGDRSVIDDETIQLSAVSSDFINYQVLASFLNFYHRDNPVLFGMFEEEVFRYLQFATIQPYEFAFYDEAWAELEKELEKDPDTNRYPNRQSTTILNKTNLKNAFNIQLKTLIGNATTTANRILKDNFNYDIEIELEYREYDFEVLKGNSEVVYTRPEIFLKIRKYYGKEDAVKKPHSFLNEAKKTAIGLAIRLGILERRLLDDKLNVLALDDLLISLDMSNREVVLKLLLEEYQERYQLLIFSHDKQFFNIAKHKIENSADKAKWLFWEFYVNEKDPAKPQPKFFDSKSQLAIAYSHLQENDYPAAANYLRKYCEEIIEKYIPEYCYAVITKEKSNKNNTLDSMLTNSAIFLDRINQPIAKALIVHIKQFVEMMLNPLSHTERGIDRHKGEIKAVIAILENLEVILSQINFKKTNILPINTELFLNLIKDANNTFKIQINLREDLFIYDDNGTVKLSKCLTDSIQYSHYETGQEDKTGEFKMHQNKELEASYNDITTFHAINVPLIANWETLFTLSDGTTLVNLMVL